MRPIRFEPYFIEEAVFLRIKQIEALGQKESAHSFHQGRTRIYETVEKEGQPKAFQDLNATFFRDLCLDKNFQDIFQEYPLLQSSGMDVYVKSTFQKRQERSELLSMVPLAR